MIIPGILFLLGLLCLIKGGDWFVDGASALARQFHLPRVCGRRLLRAVRRRSACGRTLPQTLRAQAEKLPSKLPSGFLRIIVLS